MPPVEDLENPNYKFATQVFSEDGRYLVLIRLAKRTVYMWAIMIYPPMSSMH